MNTPSSQPLAQAKPAMLPVVLLFSALALVIALLGWGAYAQQKQGFITQENAKLSAIADLKAKQIGGWLAERSNDVEVQRGCDLLKDALKRWLASGDAATLKLVESHFSSFVTTYGYQGIVLLDARGAVRLQMGEPHPVTQELRQAVELARREKRVVVTELYLADLQPPQHAHLDFVAPLDIEGMVLVLRAKPNQFLFPFIQSWPVPSATAETLLVRRDGDHVLYLNDLRHRQGASLKLRLPLSGCSICSEATSNRGHGVRAGKDYRGMPVISAWHDVPGTNWTVIAKVDEDELLKPLRDYAQIIATAVLAVMTLAGMAALNLLRRRETAQQLAVQALRLRDMEALHESEERFRATFEQAAVGVAHVAPDGHWLRVNQRLCDIVGYGREELLLRTFQDITHPDDLKTDLGFVRQMLAREINYYTMEKRYIRKDDSIVWINLTVSLVWDATGAPGYFISVIEDISQRKALQAELNSYRGQLEQRVAERTAQLETANADLENFSYSVSHDLRAPLRAIDGFASILREDYAPRLDDEGRRLFQVVSGNARKMGQLIDDILAFSRAGRLDPQTLPIDMKTLAQEAWQVLEAQRAGRAIEFRLPDLPPAQGDPAAVRQVWQNLLANAVKFTRERETALIEVGAKQEGGENLYYVRDNGTGFDMAYAGKLFGLFQRLHGMEEFEGTGVGLAIVKRFIIKQGGRVWAESQPGEGAMFWFSLPAGELNREPVEQS